MRRGPAWAHGLALNPSVPEDVRGTLVGLSHGILWHRLPTAVVDAAVAHPDWKVRALLAEAQPNITPAQWSRLILGEEGTRRWLLTMLAADRAAALTGAAYEQLVSDPSVRVREEAARLPGMPARLSGVLAADPTAACGPPSAAAPGPVSTAGRVPRSSATPTPRSVPRRC